MNRKNNENLKIFIPFVFLTFSVTAFPASFDCNKASSDAEKMICANQELSEADEKLGIAYKKAISISADAQNLKAEQRAWLKTKRNICSNVPCMVDAYKNRLDVFEMMLSIHNKAANVVIQQPLKYESIPETSNTTFTTVAVESEKSTTITDFLKKAYDKAMSFFNPNRNQAKQAIEDYLTDVTHPIPKSVSFGDE